MNIKVRIQNVYGVGTVYPVCDKAQMFADIARTKTLTMPVVALIKRLGYEIEIVTEKLGVIGIYA